MDPITTSVVIIMGKYALDKGVELGKEVGPKALDTAKDMFKLVLERIGLKKPETAAEFPREPEVYQKPLEKALDAEMQADAKFARHLRVLLAQYEKTAQEYDTTRGNTYKGTVIGSGALAQGTGAAAAGAGGIAISDNKPTEK